jgi:glycosyltransferase involved in cell wall biosynthesis
MKVLFVHFPVEMTEVEGVELPFYFESMGNEVHTVFMKGNRQQRYFLTGNRRYVPVSEETLRSIDFDLMVCKSSAFQTYGKSYLGSNTKVVNITPMGIKRNTEGVDLCFMERQLIKSPDRDMQAVLQSAVLWEEKRDQVIISGSIGGDKNQLEFVKFFDPVKFPGWRILFAGPVKNQNYVEQLKSVLEDKGVKYDFLGPLPRAELALAMSRSKLSALTTDPRPEQPFDPGPRVVFESIRAGTPCILSDLVLAHDIAKPFCFFYSHGDKASFDRCVEEVLASDLKSLTNECFDVGSRLFTLENGCRAAHEDIMSWYRTQSR